MIAELNFLQPFSINQSTPVDRGPLSTSDAETLFQSISPYLRIRKNPKAKRLILRLDTHKRVVNLTIPARTSLKRAYLFALDHKTWIEQQMASLPPQIWIKDGATLPLFGQDHTLKITYKSTLRKTDIYLKNNKILVITNKENPLSRIVRFLKQQAKHTMTELAHQKAGMINKPIQSIDIKDTASRWGSCSHDGKISLSWRLIFAPYNAMDYVIAHEVAHLKHMDHSPNFWRVCEDLSENYSSGKQWMKRHSHSLHQYQEVKDIP